jgi:hypothetical protein
MRFGTPPRPSEQGTGIAGRRVIAGSLGLSVLRAPGNSHGRFIGDMSKIAVTPEISW